MKRALATNEVTLQSRTERLCDESFHVFWVKPLAQCTILSAFDVAIGYRFSFLVLVSMKIGPVNLTFFSLLTVF